MVPTGGGGGGGDGERTNAERYECPSDRRHVLPMPESSAVLLRHFVIFEEGKFEAVNGRTIADCTSECFEESPGSGGQAAR